MIQRKLRKRYLILAILLSWLPLKSAHAINSQYTREDALSVLGLSAGATDDEAKKAYQRLIKKYHPDRDSSAEATVMSQRINEAYDLIKHPEKAAPSRANGFTSGGFDQGAYRTPPRRPSAPSYDSEIPNVSKSLMFSLHDLAVAGHPMEEMVSHGVELLDKHLQHLNSTTDAKTAAKRHAYGLIEVWAKIGGSPPLGKSSLDVIEAAYSAAFISLERIRSIDPEGYQNTRDRANQMIDVKVNRYLNDPEGQELLRRLNSVKKLGLHLKENGSFSKSPNACVRDMIKDILRSSSQ